MYKVVKYFTDLQDENHAYNVGDIFPREGLEVSEERLEELSSDKNARKMPLIEKIEGPKKIKEPEIVEEPKEEEVEEETEVDEKKSTKKNIKK